MNLEKQKEAKIKELREISLVVMVKPECHEETRKRWWPIRKCAVWTKSISEIQRRINETKEWGKT